MQLPNTGYEAKVSLLDASFGSPITYPLAAEHPIVEAGSNLSLTFRRYHVEGDESDPTPETCYEVAMWDNQDQPSRGRYYL